MYIVCRRLPIVATDMCVTQAEIPRLFVSVHAALGLQFNASTAHLARFFS